MHELEAQLEQLSAQEGLALIADLFPGKVTFSTGKTSKYFILLLIL